MSATLSGAVAGTHVVVVEDAGVCGPDPCLAGDTATATFTAVSGTRYLVVVDTVPGVQTELFVGLDCP